jgi:hypothetical protein
MSSEPRYEVENKLDEFHYHEAMHTAFVLMDAFGDHVAESQAVGKHPELKKLADEAVEAMYKAYNAIALLKIDLFAKKKGA